MSNFPSRKKWAMPGARYPGTVLAARKVRTWSAGTAASQPPLNAVTWERKLKVADERR